MIPFDEARRRLLAGVEVLDPQAVALHEAAGRVLAKPLLAPRALPDSPRSAMDGYTLRADALGGARPWRLPIVGEARAGGPPLRLVGGSACRIFTGAVLPEGADAVVAQEDVRREGDALVLEHAVAAGTHVRQAGSELGAGAVALSKGTRLGAGALGLAAALGASHLEVARSPRVAIVCTGDELRAPGTPLGEGGQYDSNSVIVATLARQAGATVRVAPAVEDDPAALRRAFDEALSGVDLLVTIGGVSVGDYDGVREALVACGVHLDFWKVAMKPGKPLAKGKRGSTHVLALPGNPAAAHVTFALFGMPLLRALQGDTQPSPPPLRARLDAAHEKKAGRANFARARLAGDRVTLEANQSSAATTSLAHADCLVVLPADAEHLDPGCEVEVWRLAEL